MERRLHDLSLEECENWMVELGLTDGPKLDWAKLMRLAKIEGTKDNLRSRWRKWEAPQQRKKIRETLDRARALAHDRDPARRAPRSVPARA